MSSSKALIFSTLLVYSLSTTSFSYEIHKRIHIHTYTYTYTHTHIHTYTYTHTCADLEVHMWVISERINQQGIYVLHESSPTSVSCAVMSLVLTRLLSPSKSESLVEDVDEDEAPCAACQETSELGLVLVPVPVLTGMAALVRLANRTGRKDDALHANSRISTRVLMTTTRIPTPFFMNICYRVLERKRYTTNTTRERNAKKNFSYAIYARMFVNSLQC